jgi:hypothetical protein
MNGRRRLVLLVILLGLGLGLGRVPGRAVAARTAPDEREEFFIVASIDAARGRIVLKHPTEVTLLMRVSAETSYRDEQGRPFRLADLRTGATAYITYRQSPGGEPTAILIKLGPMTVQELQRRYLQTGVKAGAR